MLTPGEIDRVVRRVVTILRPTRVIMFGSYAKGSATIRSDLDLLVVADTTLPMTRRADDVQSVLARTLIPVDVHVYTPEEIEEYGAEPGSFIDSVLRTGKLVFTA